MQLGRVVATATSTVKHPSFEKERLLVVQLAVFVAGGVLILFPEIARRLAHLVGIGRGVDFVIYPTVIWLVRESLLSRRQRREEEERLTELVRAIAIERARTVKVVNEPNALNERAS